MAGRGYTVGIASDTKAFKQGVDRGIIEPLQDAQKELSDLGKSRGPQQLEDDLRGAQRATENLQRSAKDTGQSFKHDAGENVKSFKEEAVQNLSEVASSFTGDMSQMADGVQGLTGGLASALTPGIGIPVAILGAAAAAFFQQWQAQSEAIKQLVSDMYDDMTQSGESFLSADFIQQGIAKVYRDQFDEVKSRSAEIGADSHTVAEAMAGDIGAVNDLLDTQNAKRDDEIGRIKSSGEALDIQQNKIDGVNAKYAAQNDWLNDLARAHDQATDKAREANAATSDYLRSAIKNAASATDEVDEFGNHLVTLPDGKQILIDAKTRQARADISAFKGDLDGKVPTRKGVDIYADTSQFDAAVRRLRATPIRINGQVVYQTPGGMKLT